MLGSGIAAAESLPGVALGLVLVFGVAPALLLKRKRLAEIAARFSPSDAGAEAFTLVVVVIAGAAALIGIGWIAVFL